MKLTPTMEHGLRAMAKRIAVEQRQAVLAIPTEATGKALERRGLIAVSERRFYGTLYRITDAGRAWLAENGGLE